MDFIKRAYGAHAMADELHQLLRGPVGVGQGDGPSFYRYVKKNPDRTLVLLTGPSCLEKGIPERIKERSSLTHAVLLPEIPDHLDKARSRWKMRII